MSKPPDVLKAQMKSSMSVIVRDLQRYREETSVVAANWLRLRLMEVLVDARLEEEEKRNEKSKESFHDRMQRIPMRPDWDDDD